MISKREKSRSQHRSRILEAARAAFAARGFEAVTMADVAAGARVARATVFNYFPSKHALIEAITVDVIAYYWAMIDAALQDEVTPTPALLRGLMSHMGRGIESTHAFYRGVFREMMKIQVGLAEGGEAAHTRAAASELLERLIARGQARGEIRSDIPARALERGFDAIASNTIIGWLYDDPEGQLHQRMEQAAVIFLGPVAPGFEVSSTDPIPVIEPSFPDPSSPGDRRLRAV